MIIIIIKGRDDSGIKRSNVGPKSQRKKQGHRGQKVVRRKERREKQTNGH